MTASRPSSVPLPSYFAYWGKARPDEGQAKFHLLPYHSLDVAAVGEEFLVTHPRLTDWLVAQTGFPCRQTLSSWLCFWLSLHDLGKFSHSFQSQCPGIVTELKGAPPPNSGLQGVRHDSLGFWLLISSLSERMQTQAWFGTSAGWRDGGRIWAQAVTGHHGQPPLATPEHMRTHFQSDAREAAWAFVEAMADLFLTPELRQHLSTVSPAVFEETSQRASWWVAGIAVLADWIGSDAHAFRYRSAADPDLVAYRMHARETARQTLRQSGVRPPPQPAPLDFTELFPTIVTPSPLQRWADTAALSTQPQLHLLEDVTGAGKTEAAVMLTHRLMANGLADGFFIGLPTMATANAMYGRIAGVYARLFADFASLALAHGRKDLVEDFAASVLPPAWEENDPAQQDDTASSRCARWLADHNKRALLAPAGVGTIDQALLAVLQAKHQSLRLLGLFRKVLVVDEVHACDAYMQRTLESLLEFHATAGGSAILLSATLPQRMKAALLRAFARGREAVASLPLQASYPLVTSWPRYDAQAGVDETPVATRPDVRRTVRVQHEHDTATVIVAIVQALSRGQCVGWIRNTVGDVLQARDLLQAHVPADKMTVFHARFTLGDRLNTEEQVLANMGPLSTAESRQGRLLIATQVAEQSLDIDLDFLVSDLAPIDRLIQRAGRLRRHSRCFRGNRLQPGESDQRGEPCLWVFGPAWNDEPAADWYRKTLPRAAYVYPDHAQLWLTAAQLQTGAFTMPDDARRLIEAVYGGEALVPEGLTASNVNAEGVGHSARGLAQVNSIKLPLGYQRAGADWLSDAAAPSRLGDESVDVVLARWHDGKVLPWCTDRPRHAWAYSTVRMPRRQIDQAAPFADPRLHAAAEAAKATMPGGGKWEVLLVLGADGARWVGQALGPARERQGPQLGRWVYDGQAGLVAER